MLAGQGKGRGWSDGLVMIAVALMGIGLVAVASASASLDRSLFGPGFLSTALGRQVIFVGLGMVILLVTRRATLFALRSQRMRLWIPRCLFVLALVGLVAALIPSLSIVHGGSQRWLRLGYGGVEVGAQPSELSKVALVLMLASLLTTKGLDLGSLRKCFLPAATVIGLTVLLVGFEDFGTAALLCCVGGGMLFVGGCRLRHLGSVAVVGVIAMASLVLVEEYRRDRVTAFLSGHDDPRGMDYQPMQSLATLASGGWTGTGLGLGTQKYGYLPASRTDFVFSIICEETGVMGGVMVIGLFAAFIWIGVRVMWKAQSRFERLIAFGITATVGIQAAMNLSVATVLAPTTGISLPLISAGGSGVLTFCLAFGILSGIARKSETADETSHAHAQHRSRAASNRVSFAGSW